MFIVAAVYRISFLRFYAFLSFHDHPIAIILNMGVMQGQKNYLEFAPDTPMH